MPTSRAAVVSLIVAALAAAGAGLFVSVARHTVSGFAFTTDDAYIYAQYAQQLAQGKAGVYVDGALPTTAITCPLWAVLLSVFALLGLQGQGLVWASALLGVAFHVLMSARVAAWLTRRCGWRTGMLGGAAVALCGPLLWAAPGGLEISLFAWLLVETFLALVDPAQPGGLWPRLALLGLGRPSGIVVALLAGLVALGRDRGRGLAAPRRWFAPLAAAAPTALWLMWCSVQTGFPGPMSGAAKSLYTFAGLTRGQAVQTHVEQFFTYFTGKLGSQVFPELALIVPIAMAAGVAWALLRGLRARERSLSAAAELVALAMLAIVVFVTTSAEFPWAGLTRYQLPGVPLIVIVAALAAARAGQRLPDKWAGLPVALILLASFSTVPRWYELMRDGARDIGGQQVAAGRWLKQNVAPGTRVGLNDAGAITFFSGLPTVDLIGLTTRFEGLDLMGAWRQGDGPRYEVLEKLPAEWRPQVYAVYSNWFDNPDLLGDELARFELATRTTSGAKLLGIHRAGEGYFKTGHRLGAAVHPRVDVADLTAEAPLAVRFDRGSGDLRRSTFYARREESGTAVADGGRAVRAYEMTVQDGEGSSAVVARVMALKPTTFELTLDGEPAAAPIRLEAGPGFRAARFELRSPLKKGARLRLTSRENEFFVLFHLFFLP